VNLAFLAAFYHVVKLKLEQLAWLASAGSMYHFLGFQVAQPAPAPATAPAPPAGKD
jgi:hypothetical protein